jgi:hypothetical protein
MNSLPPPEPPPDPSATEPIVVVGAGWTVDEAGALHPTVVLDVVDRPDVSDLPRVHAAEGVGDLTTSLRRVDDGVLLEIRMTSPVRAAFSLQMRLPEHADVLRAAALADRLVLATTEPDGDRGPLWLALDLDGPRLAELLDSIDG